jgi:hypothetical protein
LLQKLFLDINRTKDKEHLNSSDLLSCEDYSNNSTLELAKNNNRTNKSYSSTRLNKNLITNNYINRINSASSTIINKTISLNNSTKSLFNKNQEDETSTNSFESNEAILDLKTLLYNLENGYYLRF